MADIPKMHMPENGGKNEGREVRRKDEMDELPDIADEGDEIDKLPNIADEGDEIDYLPDVDDKDDFFAGGIERTRALFRKVDEVFQTSGLDAEKHIERRDKVKDIVRYCNPLEMVKSVAYFSTVSLVAKVNCFYRVINHYSPIKLDETIVGDIKNIYDDVVTPQFVKDHLKDTFLDPQYVAAEMTELTCKAVDVAAYIEGKAVLGAAEVAEDAVTFVVGTIADVAGHPEVAEKMYQSDITGKISKYIDEKYDGSDLVKDIGACAEKVGEVGAYIGLGILAGNESAVVALAATVATFAARAGEATRAAVEKTGEYTHKELAYGILRGAMSVASQKAFSLIHGGMKDLGESLAESTKPIDGKVAQYIAEKVAGVAVAAGEGALDALVIDAQDIIDKYAAYALEIDDEAEVDFKKIAKDMGMGALVSGVIFFVSDILKDVSNYIGKEQDEEIRRVEFSEKKLLTDEEKHRIKEATGWSDETIDCFRSMEEYEIYKKADLQEVEIGGKKALIRKDIDWSRIDEKGRTNEERIKRGLAPLDRDGNSIELHHVGQHADSPLAELTFKEHRADGNDTILHDKKKQTETHGEGSNWDNDRQNYWRGRDGYNESTVNNKGGANLWQILLKK